MVFPRPRAAVYLDDVQPRHLDGFLGGTTDLTVVGLNVVEVATTAPGCDDTPELHPAAGVGHTLDHADIKHPVVQPGRKLVDELGLLERKSRPERLVHRRDVAVLYRTAESRSRLPAVVIAAHSSP